MDAFDEVGIFLELIGLFLFVRELLKFEFFILIYLGLFISNLEVIPKIVRYCFFFLVAVFPRLIILVSVHGERISGVFIEIICEQLHCYQDDPKVSTTCTHTWQ